MTSRRGTDRVDEAEQLAALARIHGLLDGQGIKYWLFGGWAVDFHAGSVTRAHDDLDIAVWLKDHDRVAALLAADGWSHAPEGHEDAYARYQRGALRLDWRFSPPVKLGTSIRHCARVGPPGRRRRSGTTLRNSPACAHGSSASPP
jgi:Uncharacterised nucleotidyltransferase